MTTALISADIISVLLGRQIMTQAISDASNTIYQSLTNLVCYSQNVENVLSDLDIGNKIKILEQLSKILNNYNTSNPLVDMALEHMHDMIIRIREDIKIINKKLENHKNKLFSSWRKVNCRKEVENLKRHSNILDKRIELLFKSLEIDVKNSPVERI